MELVRRVGAGMLLGVRSGCWCWIGLGLVVGGEVEPLGRWMRRAFGVAIARVWVGAGGRWRRVGRRMELWMSWFFIWFCGFGWSWGEI